MSTPYIITILKSYYCKAVFLLALFGSYFLIPHKVFYGFGYVLAIAFMLAFSLSVTCIIRNIKEKILLARTYKRSVAHIILIALGLSALQVCGVGAPVCGATVGLGVLSIVFPGVFIDFLGDYHLAIIIFSILLQLVSLYFMGCFRLNKLKGKCTDLSQQEQG
jgi:hypothetical protein